MLHSCSNLTEKEREDLDDEFFFKQVRPISSHAGLAHSSAICSSLKLILRPSSMKLSSSAPATSAMVRQS